MVLSDKGISIKTEIPKDVWDKASEYLGRLAGPLFDSADLLSDKIRFFRFQTAVKTLARARKIAEDEGLGINEVPIKFLVPFLENCSLEDEKSDLVDRWARLLANASNQFNDTYLYFSKILSQLTSREVAELNWIYKKYKEDDDGRRVGDFLNLYVEDHVPKIGVPIIQLDAEFNHPSKTALMVGTWPWSHALSEKTRNMPVILLSLERQNLIKIRVKIGKASIGDEQDVFVLHAILTPLGYEFVRACDVEKSQSDDI